MSILFFVSQMALHVFLLHNLEIKSDTVVAKVVNMKLLPSAVVLKITPLNNNDTIQVVSASYDFYKRDVIANKVHRYGLKPIEIDSVYVFRLAQPDHVPVHPLFLTGMLIVDDDTIWMNRSFQKLPYYSLNSRGRFIQN